MTNMRKAKEQSAWEMKSRRAKEEAVWELRLGLLHARAKESGYRHIPKAERDGGIYLPYEVQRVNQLAHRLEMEWWPDKQRKDVLAASRAAHAKTHWSGSSSKRRSSSSSR